jgi:hypothetical protein
MSIEQPLTISSLWMEVKYDGHHRPLAQVLRLLTCTLVRFPSSKALTHPGNWNFKFKFSSTRFTESTICTHWCWL